MGSHLLQFKVYLTKTEVLLRVFKKNRSGFISIKLGVCLLGIQFILFSCEEENAVVDLRFYHWQTEFALSPPEKKYLDDLTVERVYTKYFDIDWNFIRDPSLF